MKIESRTNSERLTRISIFLVMCMVFTAWFAYDGFVGYPGQNLEWAKQSMPDPPDDIRINPAVTKNKESQLKKDMKVDEMISLLGQPALDEKKELVFVGREVIAIVRIENQKVIEVVQEKVNPNEKSQKVNLLISPERLSEVKPGMAESDLVGGGGKIGLFGQPTETRPRTLWFVGPAAYVRIVIADGEVEEFQFHNNLERTELSIAGQKGITLILVIVSVIVIIFVYRIVTLRVILDDDGLTFNKNHISWEQMSGLITDRYADKGWVDLQYESAGESKSLRLDSYHIKFFDDIVKAICQKKGFESPLDKRSDNQPTDHSS